MRYILMALGISAIMGFPVFQLGPGNTIPASTTPHDDVVAVAYEIEISGPVLPANRSPVPSLSHMACGRAKAILVPPSAMATRSKYSADVALDAGNGAGSRAAEINPIWRAIRDIEQLGREEGPRCAMSELIGWAKAGSLTQAKSKDGHLTRARMLAEIAGLVLEFQNAALLPAPEKAVLADWLGNLAEDIRSFFDHDAGPISSRNNHRYWAALSLAEIGRLTGREDFLHWAEQSFHLGVCQIDERGLLPLELGRGALARNYHAYALRPLVATARNLRAAGRDVDQYCPGALQRLVDSTLRGIDEPALFEGLTGKPQAPLPKESDYVSSLRLENILSDRDEQIATVTIGTENVLNAEAF
ncbi:MAG: alginate lyase family protein [Allorhizobium sp.]